MKTKHLEVEGCIINIRTRPHNPEGREVTSIEILPDQGWKLEGASNNRVIKEGKE